MSLFCNTALAERIERVEARLIAESSEASRRCGRARSGFVIPIAGGVASFATETSPWNKVAGLGFNGIPSTDALDEIEHAYRALGAPVQIELSQLADPAIGGMLTGRGYQLTSSENVLGRALTTAPEPVTPPGIEIRESGADELDFWLDVVASAAAHPDTRGLPAHEEFPHDEITNAMRDLTAVGFRRYSALHNGILAGGGSIRFAAENIAQLGGAATAPAYRGRGIQTALLAARLTDAVTAGCDLAIVTTQPGSTSQHNVQRQGFDLLYSRAILVKHP